jgi:hyaluronan synthase
MLTAEKSLSVPNLDIIFVDDGSPNIDQLKPVYDRHSNTKGITVVFKKNGGKREAQYEGFKHAKGQFIITVDSDTLITAEGIYKIVAPMMKDSKIGAITGDVRVENRNQNLLTKLISLRYWLAFNLERAAQSFSGSMLCCSGPFSIYRRDVIEKVKDEYINQTFMGQKCTYGDDRHLTNLVISKGYKTMYQEGAVAYTFVPAHLREYITQQTRWSKSFFRELLWTIKETPKISLYSLWDVIVQPVLFLNFIVILGIKLFSFLDTFDVKIPLYYLTLLVVMASLRAVYGFLRTFNPAFFLFVLYGFIHVLILMPIRLKALLTLGDNGWGTRNTKKASVYRSFALWILLFALVVTGVAFVISLALPDNIKENFSEFVFRNTSSFAGFAKEVLTLWSKAITPLLVASLVFLVLCITQGYKLYNRVFKMQVSAVTLLLFFLLGLQLNVINVFNPNSSSTPQVAGVRESRQESNTQKPQEETKPEVKQATSNQNNPTTPAEKKPEPQISPISEKKEEPKPNYIYTAAEGESLTSIARKAVLNHEQKTGQTLQNSQRVFVETQLVQAKGAGELALNDKVEFSYEEVDAQFVKAKQLTQGELAEWGVYAESLSY